MTTPRVTIGIPTYNRLHYLKEAVSSAQAQTYPDIEILISQNPHADPDVLRPIQAWCEEMTGQDPRIRYQLNPEDLGPPANFNSIADAARGEYLILIGDDDRLLPDAIEKLVRLARPGTTVVFCNHYFIDADGQRMEAESQECTRRYGRDRIPAGEVGNPEVWAWHNAMSVEAGLIRTEDFRRLRFRENIDNPDTELFILLAREGGRFVFVPEYLTEIRSHPHSTTGGGFRVQELVQYLLPLPVSPEVEPHKRVFLGALLPSSVSISLLQGDVETARSLIKHHYYPASERASLKGLTLNILSWIPGRFGCRVHRVLHRIKHRDYYRQNTYYRYLDKA